MGNIEEKVMTAAEEPAEKITEDVKDNTVNNPAEDSTKNNEEPTIVIEKTNFDKQKEKIREFAQQKSLNPEFDRYETNDGLFGWFDHNITGKEMNEFVETLQKYIAGNNEYNKKLTKEFGQVYETFDALDNEYIQGILANIKATEKVSKENSETIKALQETIKKLKAIKEENDQYHRYIDSIGDDIEKLHKFSNELDNYNFKVSALESHNRTLSIMLYIVYAIAGCSLVTAIISITLLLAN